MQREEFSRWFQQAVEESRSACIMKQCEHNRIYLQLQEDYRQAIEKIEEKLGANRTLLRPMEEALNAMGRHGIRLDDPPGLSGLHVSPALYGRLFPPGLGGGSPRMSHH